MSLVVRITPASDFADDFLLLILLLIEERRVRVRLRVRGKQTRGSWSQCMRKNERRLSVSRPTPRPLPGGEQAFVRVLSVPLLGWVSRGGFMAPMRGIIVVEAFPDH